MDSFEQRREPATAFKSVVRPADHTVATVFYDGSCALCRREIDHYRKLRGSDKLRWIDIVQDERMLAAHGLSYQTAMARLHVLGANGRWQTGVNGFVELWSHLPAYRWLAITVRRCHLTTMLEWFYSRFARWRMRQRCGSGSCYPV